jgi:transcriptional regulator with XRE-family HTH domain
MPTFGEKLRILRTRHGMTQRVLAAQLGYSDHSHIALIENGKRNPTVELVLKVADLFQITTDQLVRDELELPPETSADAGTAPDATDQS